MKAWGSSWSDTWGFTWGVGQALSPGQDVSDGAWLPSTGAQLFAVIDEASPNDTDYAYTRSHSTMEVKFGTAGDPFISTGHTLRYRLKGNGTTDAVVKLKQGATVIATWTELNVATTETSFEHTLTTLEADSITDYADLRLSIEAA